MTARTPEEIKDPFFVALHPDGMWLVRPTNGVRIISQHREEFSARLSATELNAAYRSGFSAALLAERADPVAEAAAKLQIARHRFNNYVMRVGEFCGEDWKKAKHFALCEAVDAASLELDAALAAYRQAVEGRK